MKSENTHRDDFKKLFASEQLSTVPSRLEEQIMAGIELQKLKSLSPVPKWFSMNLALFGLSIFLVTLISLFQYITELNFTELIQAKKFILLSCGIFFILWIIETADVLLQNSLNKKMSHSI